LGCFNIAYAVKTISTQKVPLSPYYSRSISVKQARPSNFGVVIILKLFELEI